MVNHGKHMANHTLVGKRNSSRSVIHVGLSAAGNMNVDGERMVVSRGKHNRILVGKKNLSRSIIQVGLPFANGLTQYCRKPNMRGHEV